MATSTSPSRRGRILGWAVAGVVMGGIGLVVYVGHHFVTTSEPDWPQWTDLEASDCTALVSETAIETALGFPLDQADFEVRRSSSAEFICDVRLDSEMRLSISFLHLDGGPGWDHNSNSVVQQRELPGAVAGPLEDSVIAPYTDAGGVVATAEVSGRSYEDNQPRWIQVVLPAPADGVDAYAAVDQILITLAQSAIDSPPFT